jgi:hypothetical protein
LRLATRMIVSSLRPVKRRIEKAISSLAESRFGISGYDHTRDSTTSPAVVPRTTPLERLKPHLPTLVLLASLSIVFILRYMAVRQHLDMGQDIANYLTTMNTFFGNDVAGTGLLRPPLIALPLKAFTLVFGNLNGAKLLGVFISVAIGLPLYLIVRRVSHRWIAVAMAVAFVITPAYATMLSWGYMTMFGIFFTLLALYFFVSILESPTKRNIILAGICASLVFGFHQLTAAFFVPLFVVLFAALLLLNRDLLLKNIMPFMAGIGVAAILTVPYVPLYVHLLQMQSTESSNTALSADLFVQFAHGVWYMPWVWAAILGIVIALASIVWLRRCERIMATLLAVLLIFPLVLMVFTLPPPFVELNRRAHFFLYAPIWAITGFLLSRLWSWRVSLVPRVLQSLPKVVTIALVASLLVSGVVVSQRDLRRGLDFYSYLDDARWNAVQWIETYTPEDAKVAAYPENLGWWIEGEAQRTAFEVTERYMQALSIKRQRALVTERLLSRNRGMDNGYIRIATSYPYTNAPGNPAFGVYVGGKYQDLLMFDDSQSSVQIAGLGTFNMNEATTKGFSVHGDSASMETVVSYHFRDATVTQTVTLRQDSQTAVVAYTVQSDDQAVIRLHLPSFFCYHPESVLSDPANGHIEMVQELETPFDGVVPVTTQLTVDVTGAILEMLSVQEDHIPLAFDIHSTNASVTLTLDVSTNQPPSSGQVVAYEVTELIKEHAIGYLAVDLKPTSGTWSDLPRGLEQWLDACPYYKRVYPPDGIGEIMIYEVVTSALP